MKVLVPCLELSDKTLLEEISKGREKGGPRALASRAFGRWCMEENLGNSACSPSPFFPTAHQPGAVLGETVIQGVPITVAGVHLNSSAPVAALVKV